MQAAPKTNSCQEEEQTRSRRKKYKEFTTASVVQDWTLVDPEEETRKRKEKEELEQRINGIDRCRWMIPVRN